MDSNGASTTLAFALMVALAIAVTTHADRQPAARRLPEVGSKFKSPCGDSPQVAGRIGECLAPIFDIVEGKLKDPQNDEDIQFHCNKFNSTDRCLRNIAKECLQGVHKTVVGSVGSAIRRFKAQECKTVATRSKYIEPLKCALKKGKEMTGVFRNHTAISQAMRDLPIPAEEKLMRSCCMLIALDREIEIRYDRDCPKATPQVLGLIHAITDDARATLCHNPRCQGAFDKVLNVRYKPPQNLIEPVMEILFAISTD